MKLFGGLYHELQVRMTYHSNHIEGRFKDGKSYPTETLYFSEGYTVMVKQ
jgi:hypothetical protein